MKSKRNVTECRTCKSYTPTKTCEKNLIRKHQKGGNELKYSPTHEIRGECEGYESVNAEAEEQTPVTPPPAPPAPETVVEPELAPEPEPEVEVEDTQEEEAPESFGRYAWDTPSDEEEDEDDD